MSTPQKATVTGSPVWSNSSPFDGYLHLGLVLPQNADGQWPTATLAGLLPQRLPIWTVVPIQAGVFDQATQVLYNASIDPPNSQYVAYWYDRNRRRVFPTTGTPPTPFTISSSPFSISLPTLTVPSTSATLPTPADPSTGV